jgi:outer membrane receptor protein involved in Fe transport
MAGAAVATVGAFSAAYADDDAPKVEKVTVTGSRIPKKDYTSNSPIATITAQQIKDSGAVTVEQLLNTLPEVVPTAGRGSDNQSSFGGAGGGATADLRGAGPNRVLVLMNGHRIAPDNIAGAVDLNTIPAALVERVEVITGGASAVYGSDAISGVVNFIMKHDYQGVNVDSQYFVTERGDGNEWTLSGVVGANAPDNRGNVTLFGAYNQRQGIYASDRDFSAYTYTQLSAASRGKGSPSYGSFQGGFASTLINNGGFGPPDYNGTASTDPVGVGNCNNSTTSTQLVYEASTNRIRGYCNVLNQFGGDRFNDSPYNYISFPAEQFHISASGEYNIIGDSVVGYLDTLYSNSQSSQSIGPSPAQAPVCCLIFNPRPADAADAAQMNMYWNQSALQNAISARTNPDSPVQFNRRFPELGPRTRDNNSQAFQMITGLKGDLGDGWSYDVYGSYAETFASFDQGNDLYKDRVINAIRNKVDESACGGSSSASINFFGLNTLTPQDLCYLRIPSMNSTSKLTQSIFSASVTGDLLQLPAGSLGVAGGFEYREEGFNNIPDAATQAGNIVGFNPAAPAHGNYDVSEEFVEADVPLVKDIPLVQYLGLELGYRYSNYSSIGEAQTYKAGGEWVPTDGLRFRAMYARADRAPDLQELFQGGDISFPGYTEPCIGATGATLAFCNSSWHAMGAGNAGDTFSSSGYTQTNPQNQVSIFGAQVAGVPIRDEKADTWTVGMVLTPPRWKNFNAAIDYYNIVVNDLIGLEFGGPAGKIAQCFTVDQNLAAQSCQGLTRTFTGDLVESISFQNIGQGTSTGVDVEFNLKLNADDFGLNPDYGSLGIFFQGNWDIEQSFTGIDQVGILVENFALPEYAATTRFNYDVGDWHFAWNAQWIDHISDVVNGSVQPATWYHQVSASWNLSDNVRINGGVSNLFDQQPRLFERGLLAGNANTDPQRYDIYGRSYFFGMTVRY